MRRRYKRKPIQKKSEGNDQFLKPTVQTKLSMGKPGDKYEVEADKMADQVVNNKGGEGGIQKKEGEEEVQQKPLAASVTPLVQKMEASEDESAQAKLQRKEDEEPVQAKGEEEEAVQAMEEEEPVQAKEEEEAVQAKSNHQVNQKPSIESKLRNGKGGRQMDKNTKSDMESGFGSDFSNVNIHTDDQAAQMSQDIGAQAFTHGNDIYFNKGKYNPNSKEGKHLLAHELTHTIQQKGAKILKKEAPSIQKQSNKTNPPKKQASPIQMNLNMSLPTVPRPDYSKTTNELNAFETADFLIKSSISRVCQSIQIGGVNHSYVASLGYDLSGSSYEYYISKNIRDNAENGVNRYTDWPILFRRIKRHARKHFVIYNNVTQKVKSEMMKDFAKLPSKTTPAQLPQKILDNHVVSLLKYWDSRLKYEVWKATCEWEKKDYPRILKGLTSMRGVLKPNCGTAPKTLAIPILPTKIKGTSNNSKSDPKTK